MILEKKIIENIKFPKLKLLEDYIFKCKILKKGYFAYKLDSYSGTQNSKKY